ncbi:uncharacterized protein BX664DRAFT_125593 [Halteromyces radiatus]|uniref:uncharacterized protein n=1 Tax=Halteromyces radiatus TaxID=101107 RepID=UPI0022211894|nr:uncharacterized protein BX664DRAFT_125593 [Halteromyces radiatus]KAI8089006.1 hypothetical protein BX664DRAFT_125593 [Halteromyces radiatus]
MNIEEIHNVNSNFYLGLQQQYNHENSSSIGLLFSHHLHQFKCYRHFLLGVQNARSFHTKEIKTNPSYRTFLEKITADGNLTVYDYLILPVQRLGHYKLFLQELIKYTADLDPDFTHLVDALAKIEEIASLSDDYHTKLIHIFQNMFQSIQNCPASLISQQRRLICHLDAVEHEMQTGKPLNPVTLFLFTDKLMVVKRPSYEADGLEFCGLDQERDNLGMMSLLMRKGESSKKLDRKLKFQGWIGLDDVNAYQGVSDLPSSFILMASNTDRSSPESDQQLETYFQEDRVRLFSLSFPSFDHYPSTSSPSSPTSSTMSATTNISTSYSPSQQKFSHHRKSSPLSDQSMLEKRDAFIKQFGKFKAQLKTQDIPASYHFWNGHHFYANIHDSQYYHTTPSKNDTAIVYIKQHNFDIQSVIGYGTPHILIVVLSLTNDQHRIICSSRVPTGYEENTRQDGETELSTVKHVNFKHQLLSNVIHCNQEHMQQSVSPIPSPQNSTKSVRDTFRQLNKRKSINTFNKILSASVKPSSPSRSHPQQKQRPKSTGFYPDIPTDNIVDSRQRTLNPTVNRHYHEQHSNGLVTPSSSFLNYRASIVKQHQDTMTGSYRASIHPTQTMSYEIKTSSQETTRKQSARSPGDSIEERVNMLCVALAQGMDTSSNNLAEQHSRTTPPPVVPTTQHMASSQGYYSQPSYYSTSIPLTGSTSSASLHTIVHRKSSPLGQEPLLEATVGRASLSNSRLQHHQQKQPMDQEREQRSIQQQQSTPVSLSSSVSSVSPSSPSPPTTLDALINEMEQMKLDFDKRLSQVIHDYERTSLIVHKLTRDLRKAFNNEIEQLFAQIQLTVDQKEDMDLEKTSESTIHQEPKIGSNTLPETQWQKKLEMTIKERNQWHQTACQLARELQDVTMYLGTGGMNDAMDEDKRSPVTPSHTTSTPSRFVASSPLIFYFRTICISI